MANLPIATQWAVNATASLPSDAILSVVLVAVPSVGRKGTGWLASDRHVVTNEHVIRGGGAGSISVQFSDGQVVAAAAVAFDALTDIAVITLPKVISHPYLKIDRSPIEIGTRVCAWGHPLGYNGPAPILSVGYLAGFSAHQPAGLASPQKRLVLNAALNPGNSGGPVFAWGEKSVRGVAVTKHAPITPYLQSAIQALASNKSGIVFNATNAQGQSQQFAESQVVAEILQYFRDMTQVVIGEAISSDDVVSFLSNQGVPWTPA